MWIRELSQRVLVLSAVTATGRVTDCKRGLFLWSINQSCLLSPQSRLAQCRGSGQAQAGLRKRW